MLSWLVPARSYLECSSYSGNQIYKIFQHLQKTKYISAPPGKQHGSTTKNQPAENGFFCASDVSTKFQVSLISATVLLWVVRWSDNLKSKLLEDCIFRKLSTADEMDQVLSSRACCHWAYNGEKYWKSQISSCTFPNTVPNKAPRSQLQGTYSKVVAWLHASSLPFR